MGSTLHSRLVVGAGDGYDFEQTLFVVESQRPLELPVVHTDSWVTETCTEGDWVDCEHYNSCGLELHADEVSALTWRLGWTGPSDAPPWSFELVMGTAPSRSPGSCCSD